MSELSTAKGAVNITNICTLRDTRYTVSLHVQQKRELTIDITDDVTAESWFNKFERKYIEELTHKTGNFKQFDIFVNMLESALLQTCEAVSLDLLTFNELQALHPQRDVSARTFKQLANPNKRYLILTYLAEFDKIHYPLSLNYRCAPDPKILIAKIRELEAEIKLLKKQASGSRMQEFVQVLEEENARLREENSALLHELNGFQSPGGTRENRQANIFWTENIKLQTELEREKKEHLHDVAHYASQYNKLLQQYRNLEGKVKHHRTRSDSSVGSHSSTESRRSGYLPRARPKRDLALPRSPYQRSSVFTSPTYTLRSTRSLSPQSIQRRPRFDPTAYIEQKSRKRAAAFNCSHSPVRSTSSLPGTLRSRNCSPVLSFKGASSTSGGSDRSSLRNRKSPSPSRLEAETIAFKLKKAKPFERKPSPHGYRYRCSRREQPPAPLRQTSPAYANRRQIEEIESKLASLQRYMTDALNM